jgi:carboxypeptidase Taq
LPGKYEELCQRLAEYSNLGAAAGLLHWDQQTYMPSGGGPARARQLATLTRIAHETLTSPETGGLLEAAEREREGEPEGSVAWATLRMARRDYEQATRFPADYVSELARVRSEAQEVWARARAANDYASFAPWLERIVELSRRAADYLGYADEPYDALLDQYEPGLVTAELKATFTALRSALLPLLKAVLARRTEVDDSVLYQPYAVDAQRAFGESVIRDLGYEFERGRQDEAVHPFTTSFSIHDVRITTRFNPNWLSPALFGTLHEAGHAMYEQGIARELEGTILASGASLGVHESQSRLWENVVGRSRPFWHHYFPKLRQAFPEQLARIDEEGFYRAVNKVSPSLIRVEADELTYNLHIMVRFELELALLAGDLAVGDAPGAWADKMEEYLEVRPSDDTEGVLQDVHWSMGVIGYFPTYSIGNLLSAQLYAKAVADHPTIPEQTARGQFGQLLGWMRENVHRFGRTYFPRELVEQATGQPVGGQSYLDYLRAKYSEIYDLG